VPLCVDELSANITTISQELNTDATTIKHVSLVGCNLASDNPTDNNTSTYGAEMLQQLKETGVESMSARSEYNWNMMLVLYCESSFKCLPLYLTKVPLSS
jgi:hypothetical protein